MKRSIFRTLTGFLGSAPGVQAEDIQSIRERTLAFIFRIGLVLGFFAMAANIPEMVSRNQLGMVVFDLFTYSLFIAFALVKRIPFLVRTTTLLLMIYLLGVLGLRDDGLSGIGRIYLTILPLLAYVLQGSASGIVGLVLSFVTMLAFGIGMSNGSIPVPTIDTMANSDQMGEWARTITVIILLVGVTGISLVNLVAGLDRASKRQKVLSAQIAEERASLEKAVEDRTASLQRRLVQIRTAAEISRVTSLNLNAEELYIRVLNLIKEQFGLYYTGLFLIEPTGQYAVLRAGTGEEGQLMVAAKHRLQIGESSMIGWCILKRKARIALDVGEEAVRFNNPYLPDTHSEIAMPLMVHEKVMGALTLHSSQAGAFDEDDVTVLQGIADVFATSIENSRLFQESQAALAEISTLHQQYLEQKWADLAYAPEDLAYTFENDLALPNNDAAPSRIDLPLTLRDQVIGTISLDTERENLSADDAAFIEAITTQTALALENARLLEETQRQVGREQTLNEIASRLNRSTRVEDILKTAVQELGKLASVTEASIYLGAADTTGSRKPASKNANAN